MIPKPKLKLFLSTFCFSVILFPNAYECCSGGGDEKGTTEAPAAGTTVTIDPDVDWTVKHTSIIHYDHKKMTPEEVNTEATRIEGKCTELSCPCSVTKYLRTHHLKVSWTCDDHPPVDRLDLKDGLEVGGEDSVMMPYDAPPPTDPLFRRQYAISIPRLPNKADINMEEGWNEYLSDAKGGDRNGPNVTVAVIDTGIDYNHPDLKDVMWKNPGEIPGNGIDDDGNGIVDDVYGADFTRRSGATGDPIDRDGHGTHCSGIIAATPNNGQGIAGVASFHKEKVKLMALKGLGRNGGSLSGLLGCLNYAIDKGAKISSNSWGTRGGGGLNPRTEEVWDAVLRSNTEHLFVAAAGNDNLQITRRSMTCGINEPNLLCVASSDRRDRKSGFSNYDANLVHVFAPGSDILSTIPGNRYQSFSGTSMACPQVSGLAALIMTMHGGMTAAEVRKAIEDNVQKKNQYTGLVSTGGLIDAGKTIKALKSGGGGVTGPPAGSTTFEVTTVTTRYGSEIRWQILADFGRDAGNCENDRNYGDSNSYTQSCTLPAGPHTIKCKDTYGDGWHGGYLGINGVEYCKTFTNGHEKSESLTL